MAAGGDFTRLSTPSPPGTGRCRAGVGGRLRSEVLHAWEPPGGGMDGALTHCVIHGLDITEAIRAPRLPAESVGRVLAIVAGPDGANLFGVDLTGMELRADDLDWSAGSGEVLTGPAQVLALVASGRRFRPAACVGAPPLDSHGERGHGSLPACPIETSAEFRRSRRRAPYTPACAMALTGRPTRRR